MLERISLLNYRNYSKLNLSFFEGNHIFLGKNGAGKTNLLESIYFLYQLKSFRITNIEDLLKEGESQFYIKGKIRNNEENIISISYNQQEKKKKILIDDKNVSFREYSRENICFFMSNDDLLIATQSMSYRREIFDQLISMISTEYKTSLYEYQKFLKKRSNLLKNNKISNELDALVANMGVKIMRARKNIIEVLKEDFYHIYKELLRDKVDVRIELESELDILDSENYQNKLLESKQLDLMTKKNNFGAHKQKIHFLYKGKELKTIASQGQIKLYIYAFKLSIYNYCKNKLLKNPLLLLDDVFADLDQYRISYFFDFLKTSNQLFLTCANPDLVRHCMTNRHTYHLEHGNIKYSEE